ncbi:hypothetical protein QOT17_007335 [Balamuthia mandrillaris]
MVTLSDTPPESPSRARPHCLVLLPRSVPFYQASFNCKEQDYTILILAFITPTGWVSSLSGSIPGSIGDK